MSMDEDVLREHLKELYINTDTLKSNAVKSSRLVTKVSGMIPGGGPDVLASLRSMLTDSDDNNDVLVSLDRFVSVGMRWISDLQSQPAAPDYSGSGGGGGAAGWLDRIGGFR